MFKITYYNNESTKYTDIFRIVICTNIFTIIASLIYYIWYL